MWIDPFSYLYSFFTQDVNMNMMKKKESIEFSDLQFLVILPDHDFAQKECWTFFQKTKLETLLQLKSGFPGNLQLISNREYKENVYKYPAMMEIHRKLPLHINMLYVQLPKEKRYVTVQEFAAYSICSQLQELNMVLMVLNAETANIESIHKPISKIHPGINMYMEKMGFYHSTSKTIELKFPCRTVTNMDLDIDTNTTKLYLNMKKIFYAEKWKSLIDNRKQGANYDNFVFSYKMPDWFSRTFAALNTCGITTITSDSHKQEEHIGIELHYDIYYYPVEMIKC